MANFNGPNIVRLVVMCLLAVAFAMVLFNDSRHSYNIEYLVLAGELVVYITIVVGIFSDEIDPELAQYTDIISCGPAFGLGLFWIAFHANTNSHVGALVMGVCSVAASVCMMVAAFLQ